MDRQAIVMKAAERLNFNWAPDYSEPGYSADEPGVILGNYNPFCGFSAPKSEQHRDERVRFARVAERLGFDLEWEDEWTTCTECEKIVRMVADSYHWTQSFHLFDECEIVCRQCIESDEDFAESYLWDKLNNPYTADTFDLDLESLGFEQIDEGEAGWHPGQTSDPETMVKAAGDRDFVFQLNSVGQFDCRFSLWVRKEG